MSAGPVYPYRDRRGDTLFDGRPVMRLVDTTGWRIDFRTGAEWEMQDGAWYAANAAARRIGLRPPAHRHLSESAMNCSISPRRAKP